MFDAAFIQLARGVYGTNGERVQVKNEINRVAGSALVFVYRLKLNDAAPYPRHFYVYQIAKTC